MRKIIDFLYNNFYGVYSFKIGKKCFTAVKASRIMFPMFLIWGIIKLVQTENDFGWIDIIVLCLLIIQYIAGFTNIIVNIYNKQHKK